MIRARGKARQRDVAASQPLSLLASRARCRALLEWYTLAEPCLHCLLGPAQRVHGVQVSRDIVDRWGLEKAPLL
jgi:hypothetical protein